MAKVSQHLQKLHGSAAAFHRSMAKCHTDALGKAVAGNPEHEFHKAAAAAHSEAAGAHDAMCEECSKAAQAADLEKSPMEPLPSGLSRVAPERTPTIRPVPRTGAPQMPMDKANAGHIGAIDFLGLKDLDEL